MRTTLLLSLVLILGCRSDEDPGAADVDGDAFLAADDCNDGDPLVNSGAPELCNGIDDNCDGAVDNDAVDANTYNLDRDGDGYGGVETIMACDPPAGYVADASDCDDTVSAIHPGAVEADCTDATDYNCDGSVGFADADGDGWAACQDCDDTVTVVNPDAAESCDGTDNNCDGQVDEGAAEGALTWYADTDGDGYGYTGDSIQACDQPTGYVNNNDDCNDASDTSHPGAVENCDTLDNDCDGLADNDAADATEWYGDADGDGHGSRNLIIVDCAAPAGFTSSDDDCDDSDDTSYPGASESCDEADNDCNGQTDEGFTTTWYVDYDGDGYGKSNIVTTACTQPNGFTANPDDCDDLDSSTNPGATEQCNWADDDCDGSLGTDEVDEDDDGYLICENDCDDTVGAINPGATEIWYDGTDQDCDGASDLDQDGDGHDSENEGGDDCDDTDASLFENCELFPWAGAHTFTTCGVSGRVGPTLAECTTEYASQSWSSDPAYFTMVTQGVQRWTVPEDGTYEIEVYGAAGADNNNYSTNLPGRGARMKGEFDLVQGEVLQIMVGQKGSVANYTGGSGGGTFVVDSSDSPLIIGGGGGGAARDYDYQSVNDATAAQAGKANAGNQNAGGVGGNGGASGGGSCSHWSGGGGGMFTSGATGTNNAGGGAGFLQGGVGGQCDNPCSSAGQGGFGGGGGGYHDYHVGGGGGYNGGGGGNCAAAACGGGGGGSYNVGANADNAGAANSGEGRVVITKL